MDIFTLVSEIPDALFYPGMLFLVVMMLGGFAAATAPSGRRYR